MKTLVVAALLVASSALATGGIQGNGIITPEMQRHLLERSRLEVLTKITGNEVLSNKLAQNNVKIPEVTAAGFSAGVDKLVPKMGASPLANQTFVANQLATQLSLPRDLSADVVSAGTAPGVDGNFLTDFEVTKIYKPVLFPQAIKVGTPTALGTLCPAGSAFVQVDSRSQVIHIFLSNPVIVDSSSPNLVRGNCSLAVPVIKAKNRGLVFKSVDTYGIAAKQGAANLQMKFEAFVTGAQGTVVPVQLLPDNAATLAKRFAITSVPAGIFAQGQDSALLRLNLSLVAIKRNPSALGIIGLDRISIRYQLK